MALLVLLAALAGDAAPPLPDLIAPAAAGKAQCYSPDLAHKTCASTNAFEVRPDGTIANTATVVIEKSPIVVMTSVSTSTISNGRLCTVMKREDLQNARFTINGAAPDDTQTSELRQALLTGFAALIDHSVCVSFVADGSRFIAHTSFDGLPRPNLDQRVMWVSPQEGWKVAPDHNQ